MKKNKLIFVAAIAVVVVLLVLGIMGIGGAAANAATVEVHDPNLKKALQEALGVTTITTDRLDDLEELDLSGRKIVSLTGLEKAVNLRVLSLRNNQVADLTPLSGLISLQSLDLCGNQISELTPLGALSDLRILQLTGNQVADLSPVVNLKRLQFVFCENNALDLTDGSDDRQVISAMEKRGIYVVISASEKPEPGPNVSPEPGPDNPSSGIVQNPVPPTGDDRLTLAEDATLSRTEDNILAGIKVGTTVEQLMSQLIYDGYTLEITYADGTAAAASDLTATGMTVQMISTSGVVLDACTLAVYGDANGDGRISVTDYLQIRKHLLGIEVLQGAQFYGGDHNGDGQLTITDALQTKAYILDIE